MRNCGRLATGDTVTVKVRDLDGSRRAGLGGVQSCGSVWACPVCSEKVNAHRQGEVERAVTTWLASGGAVMFGTATLSHAAADSLADLWDAISPSWNRMTSGAGVAWNGGKMRTRGPRKGTREIGDRERFGIAGWVRVVEVKHGHANGWHPHVHFLLFLERPLHPRQALDLQARMFGRWEAAIAKSGYKTIQGVGLDLRPVREGDGLADYFTKSRYHTSATGAAYEVTGSVTKREGKGGRTPFDLLRDIVTLGDAEALDLWHEYEKASHGRRQLTWSRDEAFRRRVGLLAQEVTDEEIVESDELEGDTVAVIESTQYRMLAARGQVVRVLEAAECDDGGRSLRRLLRDLGVIPLEQFTARGNR